MTVLATGKRRAIASALKTETMTPHPCSRGFVRSLAKDQTFLTFDSIDRTITCDYSLENCRAVLYCGAVCLTPRVKPWVIQSFLTVNSMERTLKCDYSLESCCAVLHCDAVCFSILPSL